MTVTTEGSNYRDYSDGETIVRIYDSNLVCILACPYGGAYRTDVALSVAAGSQGEPLDAHR